MYALIQLGGHQHKVEKDQIFLSELTGEKVNSEFACEDVLLVADGKDIKVGTPKVEQARVMLRLLEDVRAPRIQGFKYKKRKGYRRKWGHRQRLHKLQVVSIES